MKIKSGSQIPAWYGLAWIDVCTLEAVCFPLGLNVLARMARGAYIALRFGGMAVPSEPRAAYAKGRVESTAACVSLRRALDGAEATTLAVMEQRDELANVLLSVADSAEFELTHGGKAPMSYTPAEIRRIVNGGSNDRHN